MNLYDCLLIDIKNKIEKEKNQHIIKKEKYSNCDIVNHLDSYIGCSYDYDQKFSKGVTEMSNINYKIGDIVIKRTNNENDKKYTEKFIFLGTTENNTAKPVIITKQVMGEEVEIGIFIHKPVEVSYNNDHDSYIVVVRFYSTDLFEKDV